MAAEVQSQVAEISKNKLTDMLVGCPGFGPFFQSLESKEKRLFANMCEIIEIKSENKYISQFTPAHCIIIILKGELIGFTREGPATIYKTGEIIGIRETLFDIPWLEDLFGRQNGYLVKIQKDFFDDLGNTFAKAAMHIMDFFVKSECLKIKNKYKEAKISMPENSFALLANIDAKDQELEEQARQTSDNPKFAEIYIQPQRMKPVTSVDPKKGANEQPEMIKASNDVPPLMRHAAYSSIMKQDVDEAKKGDRKDDHHRKEKSTFIRTKMDMQLAEQKRVEKILRERKKKGLPIDEGLLNALGVRPTTTAKAGAADMQTLEALEKEYERLKDEYNLREESRDRLNSKYDQLMEKLHETDETVKMLKDKNIFVTAERDRLKLHKELMGKVSSVKDGESFVSKMTRVRGDERSFNDAVRLGHFSSKNSCVPVVGSKLLRNVHTNGSAELAKRSMRGLRKILARAISNFLTKPGLLLLNN